MFSTLMISSTTKILVSINVQELTHAEGKAPDKSAYLNFFSLFLIQNICCGYSKEPSQ